VDTLPILAPRLAAFIKTSNMFEFSQGSITKRLHLSERVLSDGVMGESASRKLVLRPLLRMTSEKVIFPKK
jgi:hypothetical protein